jgi:hypothetical protein
MAAWGRRRCSSGTAAVEAAAPRQWGQQLGSSVAGSAVAAWRWRQQLCFSMAAVAVAVAVAVVVAAAVVMVVAVVVSVMVTVMVMVTRTVAVAVVVAVSAAAAVAREAEVGGGGGPGGGSSGHGNGCGTTIRWMDKRLVRKKRGQNCPFKKRTGKPREKIGANLPLFMRRTDQRDKSAHGHKKRFPLMTLMYINVVQFVHSR